MRTPTQEEQKILIRQWDVTGPLLEKIRREALQGKEYNWKEVDTLLSLGDHLDLPPRTSEGIVEMQRIFMKAHAGLREKDSSK
jgi:hypothetical protein